MPYNKKDFLDFEPHTTNYLLVDNGEIVGEADFRQAYEDFDLLYIYIRDDERNKGNGFFLLNVVLELIKTKGAEKVFLEVGVNNEIARSLYNKVGFVEISKRYSYYDDGSDAIVMMKQL